MRAVLLFEVAIARLLPAGIERTVRLARLGHDLVEAFVEERCGRFVAVHAGHSVDKGSASVLTERTRRVMHLCWRSLKNSLAEEDIALRPARAGLGGRTVHRAHRGCAGR